jgi:hypothetical protein
MEEGLLLNGIDMNRARIAVNKGVIPPVAILPDPAVTPLATGGLTLPWTEFATDALIGKGSEIRR